MLFVSSGKPMSFLSSTLTVRVPEIPDTFYRRNWQCRPHMAPLRGPMQSCVGRFRSSRAFRRRQVSPCEHEKGVKCPAEDGEQLLLRGPGVGALESGASSSTGQPQCLETGYRSMNDIGKGWHESCSLTRMREVAYLNSSSYRNVTTR